MGAGLGVDVRGHCPTETAMFALRMDRSIEVFHPQTTKGATEHFVGFQEIIVKQGD